MAKHAFLSASASHRWINCPPSAKLCEGIKDESSHYAQEGTDCHELCAYLVEMALGRDVEDPTENLTYYKVPNPDTIGSIHFNSSRRSASSSSRFFIVSMVAASSSIFCALITFFNSLSSSIRSKRKHVHTF